MAVRALGDFRVFRKTNRNITLRGRNWVITV
jgi:hypothetical protein